MKIKKITIIAGWGIILSFLIFGSFPKVVIANYNDYSDTLIIVNDNSTTSTAIGNYFKTARSLSNSQIVHISTVTTETVSRTEYTNNIKTAIENFITTNGLGSTINYIILTKGIPIRITDTNNSVDSELAWCLGKITCSSSSVFNPFYNSNRTFSHQVYNMYVVTRLDGYAPNGDISQIEALIDHSSIANIPSESILKSQGLFVLDGGGLYDSTANPWLESANQLLTAKGWRTTLDEDGTYLTNQQNVLGYWSWGSNANSSPTKPAHAIPGNTYENGAIGETAVSTSARSFEYPPSYGQSLITDWIAEGISGIKGYVYEPGMSAVAHPDILFDHYTSGYNMADSYYAASAFLDWKDTVVGDPKMAIISASTAAQITSFNFTNPSVTGTINNTNHTVALTVLYGTDVSSLTPTIAVSAGASVSPASGISQNFTSPVTYTVTAQDGVTTQNYVVTVTAVLGTAAQITSFNFTNPSVTGTINNTNHTVALTVLYGTDVSSLTPTIAVSAGASVSPASGISQNFTSPVTYTVTAQDGVTTQNYVVTVTVASTPPAFTLLHSFSGSDGSNPGGSLILFGLKLYGMTTAGGANSLGTIFSVNTDGSGYTLMHSFTGTDGSSPYGSLILSGDGTKFYGMTLSGGASNTGTIFSVNTDGSGYTLMYSFAGTNGTSPYGSLILSGSKLYGMTSAGGGSGRGVIFSINTDGTGYTLMHSFARTDGSNPYGSLILSGDGTKFYGMTSASNVFGVIFSINTDGTGYVLLHSFPTTGADGALPRGSLILFGSKLYGMAALGGANSLGTIFSVNTDGSGFTRVHSFTGTDGSTPYYGSLILSGDGTKFYGMTSAGGANSKGVIFSVNTDGSGYTLMYSFAGTDGSSPLGSLILSGDGTKFYGMAGTGGANSLGTIFSNDSAPTLTGVLASPNPIKGGSQITITPTGQGDADGDVLNFYCNETGSATSSSTLCSQANTSYTTPYTSMSCSYNVSTGDATRTVYCRTYDGIAYGAEATTTYAVDTTPPVLAFTDNVEVGPSQSDTITVSWGDASTKKWDYESSNSCPAASGSYTKTDSDSMNQTTETNNTKYICLYGADSVGNSATIASAHAINIDVTPPTDIGVLSITADSPFQFTVTAQTALDSGSGLAAAPYSFSRNNGLTDFGWQPSAVYIDTGLTPNTQYAYQVIAKDVVGNLSNYLITSSKYTLAPTPNNLTATTNYTSATLTVDSLTNATLDSSGYCFSRSSTTCTDWIKNNTWYDTGLSCGTPYTYYVKYRNGDGIETSPVLTIATTSACAGGGGLLLLNLPTTQPATNTQIQTQTQIQTNLTPQQRATLINQIKQQLISLITQLIQLLTLQLGQVGK